MRVLFVCSQNRLRSPTAEQVFASYPGVEVASAGTNRNADHPLTAELVDWADLIFVMQKAHQEKLWSRFRAHLDGKRVICLQIGDVYEFMDPDLVTLLQKVVPPYLR